MKLNNDIWGENRISGSGYTLPYKTPAHHGDLSTYTYLYQHNYIQGNAEFDQSVLYGWSYDKTINKIAIINNGTEYSLLPPTDCGFYLGTTSISGSQNDFNENSTLYHRGGYDNATPYNLFYSAPVVELDFTNLIYALYVVCTNVEKIADRSDRGTVASYDDYFNNKNNIATNNPIVIGAYLMPFYGKAGNRKVASFSVKRYQIIKSSSSGFFNYDVFCPPSNGNNIVLGADSTYHAEDDRYRGNGKKIFYGIDNKYFEIRGFTVSQQRVVLYPVFLAQLSALIGLFCKFGVYFTTSTELAMSLNYDDPRVYIGTINDTGVITGDLRSDDKHDVIQNGWNNPSDFLTNSPFSGVDNADPNNYTDKIDLNKPTLSNVNVFNRSFAVTSNNVRQLADFLWNADETKFQEIVKGLALMGENPMNGIIDLRLFPFNVALKNSATATEHIVIGRTDTGVSGIKLTENVNSLIDLGECTFFEKFKNFLDFEPYTTAQLYIPYIGVVPVSTAEFMGHKISAKMLVDYTTGAGTAIVFKDDIPFIYKNGVVGITIPMTGTDSSTYANTVVGNVVSGVTQIATSTAGGIAGFKGAESGANKANAITSSTGGIIGGIENIYSGFTTPVQYQSAGASSPSVATWQPQKCYFIIDRPILNVPDNYGRTVGYACEQTGKLSDFKGFTVVSNPEISFKCTETEKTMLSQLLTAGVFI